MKPEDMTKPQLLEAYNEALEALMPFVSHWWALEKHRGISRDSPLLDAVHSCASSHLCVAAFTNAEDVVREAGWLEIHDSIEGQIEAARTVRDRVVEEGEQNG